MLARPRYHRFFNEAAGLPADVGPLGATCEQPEVTGSWEWMVDQWLQWWNDLGGYRLHRCVEARDQAWKIGVA